jgi:hypothetical protein
MEAKAMKKESQPAQILRHLQERGSITQQEALNQYSCWRLSAVIGKLKKRGHPIKSTTETTNGKSYSRYRWDAEAQQRLPLDVPQH